MYFLGLSFWLTLLLLIVLILFIFELLSSVLRKWLKVDKRKNLLNNYVNSTHKKIDIALKITFVVVCLTYLVLNQFIDIDGLYWIFRPLFIFIFLMLLTEFTRAFMEWKYVKNRNAYKATIIENLIFISILYLIYITDFFGFNFDWFVF